MATDRRIVSLFQRLMRSGMSSTMVGMNAVQAWQEAQTRIAFDDAEKAGLVRIEAHPEEESYWDVYGEPDSPKEKKQIEEALESMGCWYVVTEWRPSPDAEWEHADSVGMCVNQNPTSPDENCYVPQMMRAALDALEAHDERERYAVGASD